MERLPFWGKSLYSTLPSSQISPGLVHFRRDTSVDESLTESTKVHIIL